MKNGTSVGKAARLFLQAFGLVSLLGLALAVGLLLTAGLWLPRHDALTPADALVVLAGDPRRAVTAAALYRRGLAPAVYVGRERGARALALRAAGVAVPLPDELTTAVLLKNGVPAAAIRPYGRDLLSTADEAEALARVLPPQARRIIVVTSPYHCRRAGFILARALPGRDVRITASDEPFDTFWWRDKDSATAVVSEAAKFLYGCVGAPFRSAPQGALTPTRTR